MTCPFPMRVASGKRKEKEETLVPESSAQQREKTPTDDSSLSTLSSLFFPRSSRSEKVQRRQGSSLHSCGPTRKPCIIATITSTSFPVPLFPHRWCLSFSIINRPPAEGNRQDYAVGRASRLS
ncbi:unnamed protein product [Linum trigynum]|uniref:Uncharacterized protein n=1 Tax=Linum trigynum TaxID=586398 RepID=A0AAV2FBS2_9ROSI